MKFLFKFLQFSCLAIILNSCASENKNKNNINFRIHSADKLASKNDFVKDTVKGGDFLLTIYKKISDPTESYVIYIEGDGYISNGRYWISDNPTPRSPMLLELATMDRRPNVVYIARPCQYTPMSNNPKCDYPYWLDKRMSEEVIKSVNDAIIQITNGNSVDLVGFSGGGGVATLVAVENDQINSILTIAANLDHVAFNKYNQSRPMIGSLNPIDYAEVINDIPQLHVSGAEDARVPPFIADNFVKASKNDKCVKNLIIPKVTHSKGWNNVWRDILAKKISCSFGR